MVSIHWILAASATLGLSGLPACLMSRRSASGQRLTTALMVLGSLMGLVGVALSLGEAAPAALRLDWFLPWGQFHAVVDRLSAFFLALVFVVPVLGSIYGLGYWKQGEHAENGRKLGLFYGLLSGSMTLVVVSRDAVLFLIAWEVMALSAYFAASVDEENPEVRKAGWIYLIATHVGTLCLLALFALWRRATGSFALEPQAALGEGMAIAVFVLTLVGFGFKAGLMPLHVWLPGAHANAPSHVSAVMSGVMLKMGIYGIVRMTGLFPPTASWMGGVLLAVGAVTGIAGIAFAIGQSDLKRALAYSSIENIGIIAMGLGLALLGRFANRLDWILLGMGGALLHVWNHGLFKSLLFLDSGAIIHAGGTRDIDKLGGLGKRMPGSMAFFAIGAIAISALPPLNGFAGEWLLYSGFFRTLGLSGAEGLSGMAAPFAATAAVALAMIGALAVACFVKLLAAVFLGEPRGAATEHAHDPGAAMLGPMAFLAAACAFIGLFPTTVLPLLDGAVRSWAVATTSSGLAPGALDQSTSIATFAPLSWIGPLGLGLIVLAGLALLAVKALSRNRKAGSAGTWDCGYSRPTAKMQYTGSSFGQTIVELFAFFLWPVRRKPVIRGHFPRSARYASAVPDLVLDRLILPLSNLAGKEAPKIRVLQQGQTNLYVLYVLIITIALLLLRGIGL